MPERTAAEVLAEKLRAAWPSGHVAASLDERLANIAARLAEDPAITVRTDMVVKRMVVEFHCTPVPGTPDQHDPRTVEHILTTSDWYAVDADHRSTVRPYPEAGDA